MFTRGFESLQKSPLWTPFCDLYPNFSTLEEINVVTASDETHFPILRRMICSALKIKPKRIILNDIGMSKWNRQEVLDTWGIKDILALEDCFDFL
jgi:hypothetical protein